MDLLQREVELAQLDEAVRQAADGVGRVVLIRDEAGIGKSALLGAFVDAHRERTTRSEFETISG